MCIIWKCKFLRKPHVRLLVVRSFVASVSHNFLKKVGNVPIGAFVYVCIIVDTYIIYVVHNEVLID